MRETMLFGYAFASTSQRRDCLISLQTTAKVKTMNHLETTSVAGSAIRACTAVAARFGSTIEGCIWGNDGPAHPPVFILGLPRSGSTLFFHSFCHCFHASYPTKLGSYLWFAPTLAAWVIRRFVSNYRSDFQSQYGIAKGLSSPFSGNLWNLWFGKDSFLDFGNIPSIGGREAVRAVGRIERIFGHTFVDKNQRFNQWLPALAALFPKAAFLITVRDPLGVAMSILRSRYELYGSFDVWLHKRPRSFPRLTDPSPEREVAYQVRGILDDLREDILKIGAERFAAVEYERFCEAPSAFMCEIKTFLQSRGLHLKQRYPLPERFEAVSSRRDGLSEVQIENLAAAVAEAFPENFLSVFPCYVVDVANDDEGRFSSKQGPP